jgi:hypothetical protein
VVVEDLEGKVLVDPLADVEGRHDPEQQADHHAQGAEVDHGAVEPAVLAPDRRQVTVRGDQVQAGHGRGEVLVRGTRPMGRGRARSGDRDVR